MIGPNVSEGSKTRSLKDKIFIPLQCLGLALNKLSSSAERALVPCIAFNRCLLEIDFSDNNLSESCGCDIAIACGVNLLLQFLILHTDNELNNSDVETIEKHLLRNRVSWRKSCITTPSNRESNDTSMVSSSSSKGSNLTQQNPSSQSAINQISSGSKHPVLVGNVSASKSDDYRNDIAAALDDELQNESDSESEADERDKAINQQKSLESSSLDIPPQILSDPLSLKQVINDSMQFTRKSSGVDLLSFELLFGNEDLITKTNVNSVINESKVNDTANILLSSSMTNVNDLSILCIPSGWDCMEYINILLPDDSNTNRTIIAGSTLKAAATNTQNSNSSNNKNAVTNTTSLSPQHSMQSDQDFLKTLFDQQNKNAIHLGDSSATYQSSADANEISLSTENGSMNDDMDVGDIDPSAFFLNLLQSKSM